MPQFVLSGIAIGNGWIDPKEQYPGYLDFAYEKKLLTQGTPASMSAFLSAQAHGRPQIKQSPSSKTA